MNHQVSICIFTVGKKCTKSDLWILAQQMILGNTIHVFESGWCSQVLSISGWWFGTMEFYDFPFSWEFHHPNWRTHSIIFQRGRAKNHQPDISRYHILETDRNLQSPSRFGDFPWLNPWFFQGFPSPESSQILGIVIHGFHGLESQA